MTCITLHIWMPLGNIAKLPESGDPSVFITECEVWKDQAEAEGWSLILSHLTRSDKNRWITRRGLFCFYIPVLIHYLLFYRHYWSKYWQISLKTVKNSAWRSNFLLKVVPVFIDVSMVFYDVTGHLARGGWSCDVNKHQIWLCDVRKHHRNVLDQMQKIVPHTGDTT